MEVSENENVGGVGTKIKDYKEAEEAGKLRKQGERRWDITENKGKGRKTNFHFTF